MTTEQWMNAGGTGGAGSPSCPDHIANFRKRQPGVRAPDPSGSDGPGMIRGVARTEGLPTLEERP